MIGTTRSAPSELGRSLAMRIQGLERRRGPIVVMAEGELWEHLVSEWQVLFASLLEAHLESASLDVDRAAGLRKAAMSQPGVLCPAPDSAWIAATRPFDLTSWTPLVRWLCRTGNVPAARQEAEPDSSLEGLSRDLTNAYQIAAATLLPRYRQRQLAGHVDLRRERFVPSAQADYSPWGQQRFLAVALPLLLQRWLAERGLSVPLVVGDALTMLDDDWRLAVARLILAACDPVVVAMQPNTLPEHIMGMLCAIDWVTSRTPTFVLTYRESDVQIRLTSLGSAWSPASDAAPRGEAR